MQIRSAQRRSPDQVRALRASCGETRMLDVRTLDARELHPEMIPGSEWVPLAEVVEHARGLPRDVPIVAYCT